MLFSKPKILITHDAGFHTDDIFAAATLQIYLEKNNQKYKLIRTRDAKIISSGDFVFDVGGIYNPKEGKFDHHQKGGAGTRENGIPYAAFGLVWKEFGQKICEDISISNEIDRKLAQPIDANDNGVDVYKSNIKDVSPITFQDIAGVYYPEEGASDEEYLKAFNTLVLLAKSILEKSILKSKKQAEVNTYMKGLYDTTDEKKFLVVERKYGRFAVTMGALDLSEVLYVVYPSVKNESEWNICATRKSVETMESKKPFPESWAGLQNDDLAKASGVSSARFCHNGRFLCTASSKEDAINLAKLAIKD